jgi:hypothetical protein
MKFSLLLLATSSWDSPDELRLRVNVRPFPAFPLVAGDDEEWEPAKVEELFPSGETIKRPKTGGRRGEYFDIRCALRRALGRRPWQVYILDTIDQDHPPEWIHRDRLQDYARAVEIRRELERLALQQPA